MTATTIQNQPSNPTNSLAQKDGRWFASEYREASRPSLLFRLTAGLLVIAWVLLTSWLVTRVTTVGSPDEAANKYLISVLAQTGQYRVDTGLSAEALQYLHPRSLAVQGQFLASGSFLGLVQAGALIQKMFGVGAEKMLTPFLLLGGLWAMFFVFRRFWSRWWSLLGVVLIATHPAFFEFATLPYMHNGALVAGLMIGAWAALRVLERPTWWRSCLLGLTYGAALFFRPIEAIWTAPGLAILLLARKLWRQLLLVGLVTMMVQLPWLLANREIYGSWLASGYTPTGVFTDEVGGGAVAAPAKILFTPAGGVWSWHWLSSAWWYFVLLMPAWSAMAAVAIGRYFRRKYVSWSKSLKLSVLTLIGTFPLVYYGSWNLYPTTPAADVGALASYVRYWGPLYVLMAPGVVIVLRQMSRRWLAVTLALVLLLSSGLTVWSHPVSGLRARLNANTKNSHIRDQVLSNTEPNAVLIAGHADKYFQGQRLAGFRLPQSEAEWQILSRLIATRPVYLYVAVGAVDTDETQAQLITHGLTMEQRLSIGRDGLWKIMISS